MKRLRRNKSEIRIPEARMNRTVQPEFEDEPGIDELAFWGLTADSDACELRDEPPRHLYDLGERTARFGEAVIRFTRKVPFNPVNNRLIDQLVGAGTSVGANYCEADDGVSGKDFRHRIGTCRKEAKETKFFLRLVATAEESFCAEARILWQE